MQKQSSTFTLLAVGTLFAAGYCHAPAAAQQITDRATLNSLLGPNITLDDFEAFDVGDGAAFIIDASTLDSTTVTNGQGPGLVNPGATYVSINGRRIQWNGNAYYGLPTKTILTNEFQLDIYYDDLPQAMGVDVHAFEGYPYRGAADIYDAAGALVGTVDFSLTSGGPETEFVGWQHDEGIAHVVIRNTDWTWSPIINDHAYGMSGLSLVVTGDCPGIMTLTVSGATPGAWVGFGYGSSQGQTTVPGCPGVFVDIQNAKKAGKARADANGEAVLQGRAPSSACGRIIVQAADLDACSTSNVAGI
ncbi:MAG: hypothetical protein D8M59_03980 [Planctomycetes bacterium]|nr:hypothetical protein [Planctomycetota bacterium]NOG55666.1 hypothetical protein [Planctomycetota bacterium]